MTDTTPPEDPNNAKPWTYNLDVRVTPPPVDTATQVLRVRCGDNTVYVARRSHSDSWTVTRDCEGCVSIVPDSTRMTYDQAVTWATNRVTYLATQMAAGRAAARAAAAEWPDPANPNAHQP